MSSGLQALSTAVLLSWFFLAEICLSISAHNSFTEFIFDGKNRTLLVLISRIDIDMLCFAPLITEHIFSRGLENSAPFSFCIKMIFWFVKTRLPEIVLWLFFNSSPPSNIFWMDSSFSRLSAFLKSLVIYRL